MTIPKRSNDKQAAVLTFTITPTAIEIDWDVSDDVHIPTIVKSLVAITDGTLNPMIMEALNEECAKQDLPHIINEVYHGWLNASEKKAETQKRGPLVRPTQVFHG